MRGKLMAVLAVAVLLAAGCGDDDDEDGGDAASQETTTTTATEEEPADEEESTTTSTVPPTEGTTLTVADSALGQIVTDADGVTLYVFTNDTGTESTCYDQCAANWPALEATDAPTASDDITGEVGTTERTDGTTQVTLAGHPLYYFTPDANEPGSIKGQEVGGVWYVVGPDGTMIEGAAPAE
jgi:predicted lipoprotein with Yx(FWY)xxD motif